MMIESPIDDDVWGLSTVSMNINYSKAVVLLNYLQGDPDPYAPPPEQICAELYEMQIYSQNLFYKIRL